MHIPTKTEMLEARRKLVTDVAHMLLQVVPDGLSGMRLAELIGVSPHAIDTYLAGDPRFRKSHRPVPGTTNYATHYSLAIDLAPVSTRTAKA